MPSRLLLFLCGAACASAQTVSLTVDDAIRIAWANDPAVAALALTPELARAREEQAGVRPNPDLNLSAGAPLERDSEWAAGVGLAQRLPRRERVEHARALARLGGAAAEWRLREQRRLVAGDVRQLFYTLVVQTARRDAARRTADMQRALRSALEPRRAAGELAATDAEMVSSEVARAEQALAFAEADLASATQRLRRRLRAGPDVALVVRDDLDTLLNRPIPADTTAREAGRPSLGLAAHNVRQAEAALALSRAETRGDWTIGGGVEFERRVNDYTRELENEPRVSVSASVPWPRGIANRGDIREKQAALRIAEAELAAQREEVAAEIAAAIAAARALQPVLLANRASLGSGASVPDSLRPAYERGEVTGLQLAQVRQQRFALENDFLDAAARYAVVLAEAETAAGVIPSQP